MKGLSLVSSSKKRLLSLYLFIWLLKQQLFTFTLYKLMPKARIDSEPHFSELAENIILILFSDSLYVCLTVCVLVD